MKPGKSQRKRPREGRRRGGDRGGEGARRSDRPTRNDEKGERKRREEGSERRGKVEEHDIKKNNLKRTKTERIHNIIALNFFMNTENGCTNTPFIGHWIPTVTEITGLILQILLSFISGTMNDCCHKCIISDPYYRGSTFFCLL